jgi:uncharacterized membrane protein
MRESGAEPGPNGREYWRRLRRQKEQILNVRAEAARRRTPLERMLASTARSLAHPLFFAGEVVFHLAWVALNALLLPGPLRWDPFPFPLMTGLASLQALLIGLLILMYEERSARVQEVREETELQVNLHAERETTKLLRMMAEVHRALGIPSREHDAELSQMERPLDPARLRSTTEEELREVEEG